MKLKNLRYFRNRRVAGSNPACGIIFLQLLVWNRSLEPKTVENALASLSSFFLFLKIFAESVELFFVDRVKVIANYIASCILELTSEGSFLARYSTTSSDFQRPSFALGAGPE